jgi:hypothetical protein
LHGGGCSVGPAKPYKPTERAVAGSRVRTGGAHFRRVP